MGERTVSLVMASYNRAHTLPRAIASVLAQSHADWELVIVDDGSTDDTAAVVARYTDARIRLVAHDRNRGVTAAKNTGLDHATGPWIGALDSDDALVPRALGALLGALDAVDPALDAIGCNCIDSSTGRLAGRGLDRDRWLDVPTLIARARGEHWGIFHRRILGSRRFNPRIHGEEGVLWYRIHDGARWYYLHQGLRIYHTDGADRINARPSLDPARRRRRYESCVALLEDEPDYLARLARWSPPTHARLLLNAAGEFLLAGDAPRAAQAGAALRAHGAPLRALLVRAGVALDPLPNVVGRRLGALLGG